MTEGTTKAHEPEERTPNAAADFAHLMDLAKVYLGNTLGPLISVAEKANDSEQPKQEIRIDLSQLIELAKLGFGASFGSAMSAQNQNMMIMRKHLLRSEAEILAGLLALVEHEEARVETKMADAAKKSGPQKIVID